jgi:hypothetical protein
MAEHIEDGEASMVYVRRESRHEPGSNLEHPATMTERMRAAPQVRKELDGDEMASMNAIIPRTNAERWLAWAAISAVLLLWIYPAWATDYYVWRYEYPDYSNGRWELSAVTRSREFILDRSHGDCTHEYDGQDPVIRHSQYSGGTWELRTRLDFGRNFLQTFALLAISGGAIATLRLNARSRSTSL